MRAAKNLFLDANKLKEAFAQLSPVEGLQVKQNIEEAMPHIPTLSKKLLNLLEQEGLSLKHIDVPSDGAAAKTTRAKKAAKPRKTPRKRVLDATKQSFAQLSDGSLELKIGRAVSAARDAGITVLSFDQLSETDQITALDIVEQYNNK